MRLTIIILFIFFGSTCNAEILFEDNFNSQSDWTIQQPTGMDNYCYDFVTGYECSSVLAGWDGYYNGKSLCSGITDVPGHNNFYCNSYAGYPVESESPHGGSGKCLTFWQESCTSVFVNSDGSVGTLITESPEVYFRFFFKAKDGFEYRTDAAASQKLFHIQHYEDGLPHQYFEDNTGNQPVASGGFNISYPTDYVKIYAETRCLETYTCHSQLIWPMGTITEAYAEGGLLDGNWHCLEWRAKMNTAVGTADGIMEFWFDGVKVAPLAGYENDDIEWNDLEGEPLRGFKYFTIGGNTNNLYDTSCSNLADCEQWYAIDDAVVSTSYIGPDYVIDGSPMYDTPTITVSDSNTSTSSCTITGTYTIDDALTVGLCTWSHSSGSATGFAVVNGGVVSGTVTGLLEGSTTVSFSLLDSENQEATDTAIFTRPASSTDVSKGVTIQGVQWNQ